MLISGTISFLISKFFKIDVFSNIFSTLLDVLIVCLFLDIYIQLGTLDNSKNWKNVSNKTWKTMILVGTLTTTIPVLLFFSSISMGTVLLPWGLGFSLISLNTFISYRFLFLSNLARR